MARGTTSILFVPYALGALIRKVADAKQREAEVEVWGTGNAIREWMYVEDAADGIVHATERYNEIEILNLGSGKGCSIRELAEMIAEAADWPGQFRYDPTRPDGAPVKILGTEKMTAALAGWSARTRLREGIAQTVDWYRQHRELAARPEVPKQATVSSSRGD
jgi:GDP-L-fucose synthase